jgi:hypothetical protein
MILGIMMLMVLTGLIPHHLGTAGRQLQSNHLLILQIKMQLVLLSSNNFMSTNGFIMVTHFYLITQLRLRLMLELFNMYTKFMAILVVYTLPNQLKMQLTMLYIGSQIILDFITQLNTLSMGQHMT